MTENLLQCGNILSLAAADLSLALACGLLAADAWLKRLRAGPGVVGTVRLPGLAWPTAVLAAALGARFYAITATMIQNAGTAAVFAAAGSVAATHAGAVTLWAMGVAIALLAASLLIRRDSAVQTWVPGALLAATLILHSAMGHAAGAGNFTLDEAWQFVHLAAMSLWSGTVMATGFIAAPRMLAATARIDTGYLRNLSRVSTWSVAAIAVSGAVRAWTGLDAKIVNLAQSGWGRILVLKLCIVSLALLLGFLHRRAIRTRGDNWTPEQYRQMATSLRFEAICLAMVLFVSAWLANTELPGS